MPPRSLSGLSDRSPVCVTRWDDVSCGSSVELNKTVKSKGTIPLVKSVSFAEHNEVFDITHLDDIPDEDVANIWFDAAEYAQIKKDYQLTIFLMESGEDLKGDHERRGLEYRTQEGAWARYENKRDAYNAVLDEQDRQWKEDIDDWDAISRAYLEHSTKCLTAANQRGIQDEEAVADYHLETRSSKEKKKKKSSKHDKEKKKKKEKGERRSSSSSSGSSSSRSSKTKRESV